MAEQEEIRERAWDMDRDGLEPLARALEDLGYKPEEALWPAALRMSRSPQLANDMVNYVRSGQPALEEGRPKPPQLLRRLPGGYTVASMIEKFLFNPAGSFLMASELFADEEKALSILERFIEEGYWKTLPDGTKALVELPIAQEYPTCPRCGRRWARDYEKCPRCGYNNR